MKVQIKEFNVQQHVKTNGIEFEIRTPDGKTHYGDCYLTKVGLIWCAGRTDKRNGLKIPWKEFIEIMKSPASKKAALKAARDISKG